jgi:threonine dehydrogenase-like Zn-dependent dehydrogenase
MRAAVMRGKRLVVAEFAATLRHIAEGAIPTAPLITGKVGVEGVAPAFEELGVPERHVKILVEPWRN